MAARHLETAAPGSQHDAQDGNGEEVAEQQDRIGVHARFVERQGEERVGTVGGGRNGAQEVSFGFGVHGCGMCGAKITQVGGSIKFIWRRRGGVFRRMSESEILRTGPDKKTAAAGNFRQRQRSRGAENYFMYPLM